MTPRQQAVQQKAIEMVAKESHYFIDYVRDCSQEPLREEGEARLIRLAVNATEKLVEIQQLLAETDWEALTIFDIRTILERK
jgi:hypothetical protein